MTDVRLPERWLNDRRIRKLSADELRTFVFGLLWVVGNRTDGDIDAADLELIPDAGPGHAVRLVDLELWSKTKTGWRIVDFELTQTSRGQLEGLELRKRQDADRQRAKRDRDRDDEDAVPPGPDAVGARDGHAPESRDVTPDPSRDGSRDESRDDIGKERTGKDRTGKESLEEEALKALSVSSNFRDPSSMELCHGCGVELDNWSTGSLAGHCQDCSGDCSNCMDVPDSAAVLA
ncbi:hypothetical protein QK292_08720 [Arthrobacter sp. AL08]|uniref:hypothetical protein n=1 Tax=unclassified Arthrobacter TaxID=235627 RepID=UPI00249AF731|nr:MULTISPECIES: hypothetical protein [unclassified Arthrobacter]MDI3241643.1 hypothetical protein [Arthrobacter sp. AL05]MDI3277653.1 hypothetical protein [Arthrobacter sp. AL08]